MVEVVQIIMEVGVQVRIMVGYGGEDNEDQLAPTSRRYNTVRGKKPLLNMNYSLKTQQLKRFHRLVQNTSRLQRHLDHHAFQMPPKFP